MVLCAVDHASLAASPYGPEVDSLLLFAVENVMDELLGAAVPSACCWMENDRLAFVAAVEDYDGFLDLLAASRDTAGQALHLTLTLTASQLADSPESIPFCWDSCLELLNHRLELGSGLITEADVQRGDEGSPMLLSQQLREVLTANAENGNTAGFAAGVDKLVAEAKAKPLASPEIAYAAFMSILSILITALNNRGWKAGEVFGLDVHPYQAVTAMETLDEMGAYVKQLQAASVGYLGEEKQTKNKKLLEHVTRYIQENYHQPLQLATVAEHVYLSPSYLSRLFRQEVGKTFLEYLTEVRIEKSKELLRQPELRLADIAERTQFGTANNFIKVFKKHQGITPGQYRGKLAASTLGAGGEGGVACEEG